jgi:hypothetical protein
MTLNAMTPQAHETALPRLGRSAFMVMLPLVVLAALASGRAAAQESLLGADEAATFAAMEASLPHATREAIEVSDQPFIKAARIVVQQKPARVFEVQISVKTTKPVAAKTPLRLAFYARAVAGEPGEVMAKLDERNGEIWESKSIALGAEWRKFEFVPKAQADNAAGQMKLSFFFGQGVQTVDVGGITLEGASGTTPIAAGYKAPAVPLPPVPPADMDAYHSWLLNDLKTRYGVIAAPVFGATEDEVAKLVFMGGPAVAGAKKTTIDITDQPFGKAVAFDVREPKGEIWHIMGGIWNPVPLLKDRTYLITFYARGRVPGIGGTDAVAEVSVRDMTTDRYLGQQPVSVGDSWQRFFIPFVPKIDAKPKSVQFPIVVGMQVQQIEFGGITVLDCGDFPADKLPGPKTTHQDYEGRKPDAPWRKAALERIERIRKADLTVRVVDAAGQPVPDATVKVDMTRHAFKWGTSIVPSFTLTSQEPLPTLERENLPRYFNHIAIDSDLKQYTWVKRPPDSRQRLMVLLKRLKDAGYTVNNGVIVWPGFRTNQSWLPLRDKPDELRKAVDDFISEIATMTEPYIDEVVVVNEPYADREIARLLGEDSIPHWFRMVRRLQPNATLWLNEAGLTSNNSGYDTPRQEYIYQLAKSLVDQNLLDGIGDQAHFNTPVEPEQILKIWDRLASLGKPLQVTEFDVKFGEDDALEADFTRDFTILAFSYPAMEAFTMWGFIDELHWKKNAPLFSYKDGKLVTKPSGKAWIDLVKGQWWTNAAGATDAAGEYRTRGFLGDYDVTVTANQETQTVKAKLTKEGTTVTVKLD